LPSKNANGSDSIATALAEISDRLTRLVQDEIELAKTEVAQKASSLARGAAAVAAGAVFGIFAVIFFLLTLAWVFDGIFVTGAGSLWLGFLIVLVILLALTVGAFMFAWKKLKVGAPTPKMAISEGKKIKDTVTSFGSAPSNGRGVVTPEAFASVISPALAGVAASAAGPAVALEAPDAGPASLLSTPEPAPVAPEIVPKVALAPEPASEPAEPATAADPPTFVSVPETVTEPPASVLAPDLPPAPFTPRIYDPPALLGDRPSGADEEPVFGVEPVSDDAAADTDSPSPGPEN
jgi:hypothetical protein